MKQTITFLAALALASVATSYAQPSPTPVVPGVNGTLSRPADAPVVPANTIPGFHVREISYHTPLFSGSSGFYQYFIYTPNMYPLGIESFDLQYLSGGSWVFVKNITSDFDDICFGGSYDSQYGQYRLLVHGGIYDGYVTNEVTISDEAISRPSADITGYGWSGNQWDNPVVGDRLQPINVRVDYLTYEDGKWTRKEHQLFDDSYYLDPMNPSVTPLFGDDATSTWYRRNPYTCERTPITPNADNTYTVKAEDWGYEICFEVQGNPSVCDFHFELVSKTPVMAPVDCHFSYKNTDGFIINTNYALPILEQAFDISYYGSDGKASFTDYTVSQITPGTYAVKLGEGAPEDFDLSFNKLVYDYAKLTYYYGFMEAYDENHPNSKHQGIYYNNYPCYFNLKVTKQGNPVEGAKVVASRKNLSGVVEETEVSLSNPELYLGEYLLYGEAPGCARTYYKRTLKPDNAELVIVPNKVGEGEWWEQTDQEYLLELFTTEEAGINEISADASIGCMYDVLGRPVAPSASGFILQRGQKTVVR